MQPADSRRLKVLISAYACQPGTGSEPGIGWSVIQEMSRYHEIWALTASDRRERIEAYHTEHPNPNIHWIYLKTPGWMTRWKKSGRLKRVHYHLWQIIAYFAIRKQHKSIHFDLIHHITFGSYWTPIFLSLLPVPFIWGPIGGGEDMPRAFYNTLSRKGQLAEWLRDFVRTAMKLDPFLWITARRTAIALATTNETAAKVRKLGTKRIETMPAVALPQEDYEKLGQISAKDSGPYRLISIGRLLHWKGVHLALRAFAKFHETHPESEYWIIGDGPERKSLEQLAAELNLKDSVRFWGNQPRQDVFQKLSDCDALLHLGMHESGGYVTLEGMAARRPIICFDLGGPAMQITPDTGISVPAQSPQQGIADLAAAMAKLAADPALRQLMGAAGRERISTHFSWEGKCKRLNAIYLEVTA